MSMTTESSSPEENLKHVLDDRLDGRTIERNRVLNELIEHERAEKEEEVRRLREVTLKGYLEEERRTREREEQSKRQLAMMMEASETTHEGRAGAETDAEFAQYMRTIKREKISREYAEQEREEARRLAAREAARRERGALGLSPAPKKFVEHLATTPPGNRA